MTDASSPTRPRARWTLLAVAALFLLPPLAAVAWYYLAPQTAPPVAAHGSLIDPARPLEPFELARPRSTEPFTLAELRGRWTLVHVVGASCDEACRERLYYTRQIHTALNEDQDRVQRLLLAANGRDTDGLTGVLAEHPRLTVLAAGADDPLRRQLPDDLDDASVLLIDPLGNLMLRFGPEVEPKGILEDLEKVLKLSRVG